MPAMALLLALGLCLPAGQARAAEPYADACTTTPNGATVQVSYPKLAVDQSLDFWQIPWKAGDKLHGALQVQTTAPLQDLKIRMVGGAAAMDIRSRRFISASHLVFTRDDSGSLPADGTRPVNSGTPPASRVPPVNSGTPPAAGTPPVNSGTPPAAGTPPVNSGTPPAAGTPPVNNGTPPADGTPPVNSATPPADAMALVANGSAYVFNFTADEIPGEDTYCAHLEAVWGDADNLSRQTLPSLKLKAYGDATVRVLSGRQLQAQWTNLDAPLDRFKLLQHAGLAKEDVYFNQYNPEPTLTFTMPGNPNVASTQLFDVEVAIDPVLDEQNIPTPYVLFWIEQKQQRRPEQGETVKTLSIGINESFRIHIFRNHTIKDGQVLAPRIPPGKYHTTVTITTPWGSRQEPVEIAVRDAPLWPALTLIAGVLVSLVAARWERRQPLYQAQLKARRWRRFYILQGLKLFLVEAVLARVNLAVAAADVPAATRAADLLENLLRSFPDTLILEGVIQSLLTLPQGSPALVAAAVTGASTVAEAHAQLAAFCAASGDPAVQELGAPLHLKMGYRGAKPAPLTEIQPAEWLRWGLREWLSQLFIGVRRSAARVAMPSMWDTGSMVVFFVLINGGMITLQLVEAYQPNATFGSPADYLSLLFWGFAGDTTRKKLTDLAAKVLPTETKGRCDTDAPPPTTQPDVTRR